jgi:hypothetical protein
MIQYSLVGRTAASIRLNTTFRGLAPSPSSGKTDLVNMVFDFYTRGNHLLVSASQHEGKRAQQS